MILFLASLFSFSCKVKENKLSIPEKSKILGLATPVDLGVDSTEILLADFFVGDYKIDSIQADKNLNVELNNDNSVVQITVGSDSLPAINVMNVFADGYKYSVLLRKSRKVKYEYIFDPKGKQYSSVSIRGEMNAWNAENSPLKFDKGVWSTELIIEPGKYQYLLVIDGKDHLDPNNSDSISNNMGGFNSLLAVGNIDNSKNPYLYTSVYNDNTITIGAQNKVKTIIAFWDNYQLPDSYIKKVDSSFIITIPSEAANFNRSYIRVWACNKNGISNDIKVPLQNGKVLTDASNFTREDYEAAVIYNVFVDRFFDGNPDNNRPINEPDVVLPKADYHGGDIAGVAKVLKDGYFDTLGINTVWLSPVVKNVEGAYGYWPEPKSKFSAYHGYWPMNFSEIDDRFGTTDEFKQLVNELHTGNKNILVDFVGHHLHESSSFVKEHPNWFTDLYLPDGSLNTERWDDHRLTTWFDVFLPTLDSDNDSVVDAVSDSALVWFNEYGIDGFRHDAAKHVNLKFWTALTKKIKNQVSAQQDRKIYQIGETYGTPELVGSYVNSGMLDAQFDFNVYDAIVPALSSLGSFKHVASVLKTSFKYYGYHNLMGYITGNQDRGRFISYASGTLRFDEDAKVAGWTRDITVGDSTGYQKSAMLFAFINTIPGIPVIYYGDEIGMPGGNDPDNRRMMRFDNLSDKEKELKDIVAKLIKLRRSSLPLTFGDFKFLLEDDDVLAYQRTYFDKTVVVVFNKSDKKQSVSVPVTKFSNYEKLVPVIGCCFSVDADGLYFDIKPYSFEIFVN